MTGTAGDICYLLPPVAVSLLFDRNLKKKKNLSFPMTSTCCPFYPKLIGGKKEKA